MNELEIAKKEFLETKGRIKRLNRLENAGVNFFLLGK